MKRFIFIGLIFALPFLLFTFTDDYNKVKTFYELKATDHESDKGYQIPQKQSVGYEIKNIEKAKKTDIGEIVITARNFPEFISLVPKDLHIVKPETEKLYGEDKIKDILDNLPGIYINKAGANDSLSTVSIRGTGSKYTLVLLDGIPLNDFMTGGVDLNKIDIMNIGKIEIIKTGMSSIYGADASSGVINILTGDDKKYYIRTTGIYGTADFNKYSISSNSKIFNLDYFVNYSEEKKGNYFPNSDVDKKNAMVKISFFNNGLINAVLTGSYFKRNMGIPFNAFGGTSIARQYDEDYSLGLLDVVNMDFMVLKLNGYLRSADLIYDDPDTYYPVYSRHIKKEYQTAITGIYEEGEWFSLLSGVELNIKNLDSTDIGKKSTLNSAAIVNGTLKFLKKKLIVNGGVRFDFNSQYGNFNSTNLTASYKFPDKLEVYGSIDKSFSAPTFGNLYWPTLTYDFGTIYIYTSNSDLKPEQEISYEAGLKKSFDKIDESICLYYKDITNIIRYVDEASGNTITNKPINIDWAKVMGFELEVNYFPFDFLTLKGKCDFKLEKNEKSNTGTAYTLGGYEVESTYRLAAFVKMPFNITIGINGDYINYNKDYKGRDIKPYFLLGGRLTQQINENFEVYLQVENLLDNKEYKTIANFPMPGREFYAGIKTEF